VQEFIVHVDDNGFAITDNEMTITSECTDVSQFGIEGVTQFL